VQAMAFKDVISNYHLTKTYIVDSRLIEFMLLRDNRVTSEKLFKILRNTC